jgi:hypothetical protein
MNSGWSVFFCCRNAVPTIYRVTVCLPHMRRCIDVWNVNYFVYIFVPQLFNLALLIFSCLIRFYVYVLIVHKTVPCVKTPFVLPDCFRGNSLRADATCSFDVTLYHVWFFTGHDVVLWETVFLCTCHNLCCINSFRTYSQSY